jgi:maltooligosyltrehalose trehalohydrolase
VFYELHVGTFSEQGDYQGVRDRLAELAGLGITAIELMPIADFPGRWNWGYDGAAWFAPARCYGRPEALVGLIDEAHRHGIAVFLDVVYNHFGPDGAYALALAPEAISRRELTPWGCALDFDGPGAPGVRRWVLDSARMWLEEYGFDGLRLDSTFAMVDRSADHILAELGRTARAIPGPRRLLIAEDHRNYRPVLRATSEGGLGMDAMWADDFHHQLRRILTGERHGYFADFDSCTADLARCVERGWLYSGQTSIFYGGLRGDPPDGVVPEQLVFCTQNHDQVGNRPHGDRMNAMVDEAAERAATALLLLAPQVPLLFMGQEWGATTPFRYFTDHHPVLGDAVAEGRRRDYAEFSGAPAELPDPQAEEAFEQSKLDWSQADTPRGRRILAMTAELIALRRSLDPLEGADSPVEGVVVLRRGSRQVVVALRGGLALELSGKLVWHTEAFADPASPPQLVGGRLTFSRPGAAIVE